MANGTSTVQNPLHRYTASGTYTVTLVGDGDGLRRQRLHHQIELHHGEQRNPHGISLPSNSAFIYSRSRARTALLSGITTPASKKILFGGLASTEDGTIVASAAPPGTYQIWAKRTYSQGPMYGFDVQIFDQMKLGQSVDNDSAAKMGSRELINSLWVTDRARPGGISMTGYLDAPSIISTVPPGAIS